MTGFSEVSQIAPAGALRAAEVRFGERRAIGRARAGSYWLLLVFVFLLYLNLPVVWPGAELIHPAKIVAGLALITLLGETMLARGTFELGWPEGGLLIGFLGIAWVGIFANPNDLAYSLVILVPVAAFLAIEMGWWAPRFGGYVPGVHGRSLCHLLARVPDWPAGRYRSHRLEAAQHGSQSADHRCARRVDDVCQQVLVAQ